MAQLTIPHEWTQTFGLDNMLRGDLYSCKRIFMSWKDRLKKLREEAKLKRNEQKLEHQILAEKVVSDVGECLMVLEEFCSVAKTQIRLLDNRHAERDQQSNKKYFTGGITLRVERRRTLAESLFRPQNQKSQIIALIGFPHPQAIKNVEWYEDCVGFAYSDIRKKLPLSEFNLKWLRDNLEEAYQYFLAPQR